MVTLSSSFLQKHSQSRSPLSPPPPSRLLQSRVRAVRINEKPEILITPTPIKSKILHTPNESKITAKPQSPLTAFFNSLDHFISDFIDPPLRPSTDPKHILSGNYAPVEELPPTACVVEEGSLPLSLNGAYIRNGPNPQFVPRGPYHPFDGDGMLHSVRIFDGKAVFCSRFVRTYKYNVEREMGSPVVLNYFSAFTSLPASLARSAVALGRVLAGEYDPGCGTGSANTSLACFGGNLFALNESDVPYRVKVTDDGDIITLGRYDDLGESMTAHLKVDRKTGETFAYRHGIWSPFLTYFRINPDGTKQPDVPIFSKKQATMTHDFAITENYAIFPDSQVVIEPKEIIAGKPLVGVDFKKMPKLGIIPRYATDESGMWWVDVPGLNVLHAVNAWEEDGGETIVLVATNMLTVEYFLEDVELLHLSIERIEINVKTKVVTRRPVSARCLEFGVINPAYVGRKTKYVYAAVQSPAPKGVGLVKLDLSLPTAESGDCVVASRIYGDGCYSGEPYFVAREPDNPAGDEDDGYVMTYLFNEITKESKFLVMDAKSPTLEIVASVKLPRRVPDGFHGIFVSEEDLKKL